MRTRMYMVLVLSCFGISLLFARNQKLLFNDSTLKSIRNTYNKPSLSFPFDAFKSAINGYGSVTRTIVAGTDFASYDAEKADLAKLLAFRYCVETNAGVEFGDRAFYWLSTKYAEDNYVYQVNDWSSWMVNAMALKDYCLAFDILCAGGYFDPQNHPSDPHNQVYWEGLKQAILQKLHEKAAAIYNRVKNFRTVNDAAGALFGNPTVLNEAKFHAQVGNHRIIVAAGLGVAAYLLSDSLSSTETDLWLNYAKTDVEQFLLGRQRYPPIGGVTVVSQNVEGAFPEGVEYLNYSGLAFIPFMIASRLNGGENYLQDPNFKKLMNWCYDLQMPDGTAPQINSTGYLVYPINAMTGTVITGGSKYLGQLKQFLAKTPGVAGLPIESFSLLDSSASAGSVLHDPITYTPAQGELIMRTPADSATRYLLVTAKNGPARYAAELHAYADAGSYLFQADGRTLVLHPGYAGYSASQDLERAKAHNTICPVVQGAVNDDAPNRDNASPPAADASITKSTYNTNFSYAAVDMELYGSKPLSTFDEGLKLIAAAGNLPYDYGNSLHMTWKNNGEKFGSCGRKFLMVNNSYLIVRDDVTQANTGMQYAVSSIHGNNGNNITAAAALASGITTSANGESIWAAGSTGPVLRVNTAALRGKIGAYSNLEASVHQMADPVLHPDSPRAKYYHAALRTACGFTDHYGQMLSILESDPNTTSKTGITTKWNADTDPYLFYTVDGRGKSYGRYDILFSQKQPGRISIAKTGFSFPIETDASFLVVSYGGDVNDTNQIKIFSNGATFIHSGTYTFIPNDSGEAQTSFVIKRDPVPVLSVLPSVYRRDTIAVGDSSVQKFVIKNSSNADLIYQVLSIQTTTFAVSGSPGGALKSLDSAVFSVVFKPRGFAFFEDTLTITSNGGTKSYALSGFSPYPSMIISSPALVFGDVLRDSTARKGIVIRNASINTLRIDSMKTGARQFTVNAFAPPVLVTRKDSAVFIVSFKPDTVRLFSDTLRIYSNQLQPIMKIPLTGTRVTSARLVDNILPAEYALNQNFPNPFNPSTTLRYALPVDSRVRLQIFNVLGQQVDEVVNAVQSAGRYEIFWNANAASGVYVYRLEAISRGDPGKCFVDVKKMILMR